MQTPFVPVRKVNTAPAMTVRCVLSTHSVALALESSGCVSGPPGQPALWVGLSGGLHPQKLRV